MNATVYVVMRGGARHRGTRRTLAFLHFFYAEAARQADALGYVALPDEVVTAVKAYWTDEYQVRF